MINEITNLNIETPIKKWAFIDENNTVIDVLIFDADASEEFINQFCQEKNATKAIWCDNFIYAAPGATYHIDHFRPRKPYDSWIWGVDHLARYNWVAPVPHPEPYDDFNGWMWDEESLSWKSVDNN